MGVKKHAEGFLRWDQCFAFCFPLLETGSSRNIMNENEKEKDLFVGWFALPFAFLCVCGAAMCDWLVWLVSVPGNAGTGWRAPHAVSSYLFFVCVCVLSCSSTYGVGELSNRTAFFVSLLPHFGLPFRPNASMNAVAASSTASWSSLCCNELSSLLFLQCTVLQLRECSLLLIS